MSETRSTGRKVTVGDMIVRIGKQRYDSRIVETYGIPAGTRLSGPRGGRKVLNAEGERQGGRVLVLKNGRKPVVFDDTTIIVLRDEEY